MSKDVFQITCDDYTLLCSTDGLPDSYELYRQKAALVDEIALEPTSTQNCFLAVRRAEMTWPYLVVAQGLVSKWPSQEVRPGALLVSETHRLFVGAQERLLAYELNGPAQLWEDAADSDFWHWRRSGSVVLMAAELQFAAWNIEGRKLWATFVEPPWDYNIAGDSVYLNVSGYSTVFPLTEGPPWGTRLPWTKR